MKRRRIAAVLGALTLLTAVSLSSRPARAISGGELDSDNRFPCAGAVVVVTDPTNPQIVSSGVLVHPRVLLTAGHSTAAAQDAIDRGLIRLADGRVSFGTDAFDPATWREIEAIATHPGFFTNSEADRQDVGVVILKQPADLTCATLGYEGLLDDLRAAGLLVNRGVAERFVTVGYGATLDFPPPEQQPIDGRRRFASSEYCGLTDLWLILNKNPARGNGGGAAGDSGGPVFWRAPDGEFVLVALHSHSDPQRVSLTKSYRLDTAAALDFIGFAIGMLED